MVILPSNLIASNGVVYSAKMTYRGTAWYASCTMIRKILARSFVRYVLVGLLSVAIDYGLLLGLYHGAGFGLGAATTVSFGIGLTANFLLTKYWTFGGSGRGHGARQSARQMVLVGLLTGFNLMATNLVVWLMYRADIGPEVSKLVAMAMVTLWNYVIYKNVIFKAGIQRTGGAYLPEEHL